MLREIVSVPTELDRRYDTIHDVIMAGPAAWIQERIDDGRIWDADGRIGSWAVTALIEGVCVCAAEELPDLDGDMAPAYWSVDDEPGSPGSVANAETYYQASLCEAVDREDPASPPTAC